MKRVLFAALSLASWLGAAVAEGVSAAPIHSEQNNIISEELFSTLDELARIVDVSYCVGTSGIRKPFDCLGRCGEFEGFELVKTWHTGPLLSDSCGFLALSHPPWPKRIIVGFRGTYSLANVAVDLAALPQPYTQYNHTIIDDGTHVKCSNCTVHTGFLRSWHSAREEILSPVAATRARFPEYELTLVGHSLGGAVAALAGLEFSLRGWTPHVTTFGEPRVGNAALAEFINDRFDLVGDDQGDNGIGNHGTRGRRREAPSFHRVTHADDPVPLLPFVEWGYAPHAGEIFISKVDLPPAVSDVWTCQGNKDPSCSDGADPNAEVRELASFGLKDEVPTRPASVSDKGEGEYESTSQARDQIPMSVEGIPRRLQLWELFFAHRDYFWRLGVCLPQFGGGKDEKDHSGHWKWWERVKKKFRPWAELCVGC